MWDGGDGEGSHTTTNSSHQPVMELAVSHVTRAYRCWCVALQGDLLVFILRRALAHDAASTATALRQCLQRDRLLIDAMELRECAVALHLDRPRAFTLTQPVGKYNTRAVWAKAITHVERVSASYVDESSTYTAYVEGLLCAHVHHNRVCWPLPLLAHSKVAACLRSQMHALNQ